MSSPETDPVDPPPINPPDNTDPTSGTQQTDLGLTDEEENLGFADPTDPPAPVPAPAINPPDNT